MTDRCLFCDAPATHLCDAVIALPDGGWHKQRGKPPYRVTTMEAMLSESHTCDAPFCAKHGKTVGHISGKDCDTIDHCAGCAARNRGTGNLLLSHEAIAALRRQWHQEYRRGRVALANAEITGG